MRLPRIAPLDDRLARYERIIAMRGDDPEHPKMSYEEIGASFTPPLTRERVRQIIAKPPRRPGRPTSPGRRDVLRRKLAFWEERRTAGLKQGNDTSGADERIVFFSGELARPA